MPRSTTNATLSGGSCGFYGPSTTSVPRSCYDCLTYMVTSESKGCMLDSDGRCVSMTSFNVSLDFHRTQNASSLPFSSSVRFQYPAANTTYCDALSLPTCTMCLAMSNDDGFCDLGSCVCVGACEKGSETSQAIDQANTVLSSAFSKLLVFLIVLIIGVIAIIALATYCCYKRRTAKQWHTEQVLQQQLQLQMQQIQHNQQYYSTNQYTAFVDEATGDDLLASRSPESEIKLFGYASESASAPGRVYSAAGGDVAPSAPEMESHARPGTPSY